MNRSSVYLLTLILLTGCVPFQTAEPTAVVEAVPPTAQPPTATWTNSPEPTHTSSPTYTPAPPTQTPAPTQSLTAVVSVQRINLRRGPGTVFPILDSLEEGTEVIVLGKALGEQWVKVAVPSEEEGEGSSEEESSLTGWMLADFLDLGTPVEYLGFTDVNQAWLIEGKVLEEDGTPVDGVDIAVSQGLGADELRTDTFTLENGRFYVYLPWESAGIWQVEAVGLRCESRLMLENCRLKAGYYLSIPRMNVEVPSDTPLLLLFAYSEGGIQGTVYVNGEIKEGVRIRGDSASGAFSWDFTENNGNYELALGEGVWTVYAVDGETGLESDSMTVALGAGQLLTDVDFDIR
ncbi:MAG: SH3 domain-containing protein [Anaerolineales bacterium]|nr:SH3 domain-containing protein [Anaerolineales bacterium]